MNRAVVVFWFALITLSAAAGSNVLQGVAATVNGEMITYPQLQTETDAQVDTLRQKLKGQRLVDAIVKLRKAHLETMIDRQLLLQELKRRASSPAPGATDTEIDQLIRVRFHSDRKDWLKRLRAHADIHRF